MLLLLQGLYCCCDQALCANTLPWSFDPWKCWRRYEDHTIILFSKNYYVIMCCSVVDGTGSDSHPELKQGKDGYY